ncbi:MULTISPECIES: xanthine dehydrogenase family protein molybdopterin-binding subunit [Rhodomicrobium]|uniref:xanthine dehydrogenase family protein molybdopterin-binding subunit n=1 Tax=Rhodomicrobium TaxID=1068 RepID=UPI000B4BAC70|nr:MULTISPECIES: xanthine dehydrogenase family protein molybdopterin-binding subunit [Rhodomicrobium]
MTEETATGFAQWPLGNGPIGEPLDRVDGQLKVTGKATYAYEQRQGGKPLYGFLLGAAIGKGRITAIDVSDAARAPGVVHVMTHENVPEQGAFGPPVVPNGYARPRPVLTGSAVQYYDEPVAFVVAESFEAARFAAGLISVHYDRQPGAFDLTADLSKAYKPEKLNAGYETDSTLGDFEGAFAAAPVQIEQTYSTPYECHAAMEPHAALALWSGDELTVYMSTQVIANARGALAATLKIPVEKVRVVSPFTGGGFGSKLLLHAEPVFAALAARELKRPVKVALTRQQMFANTGFRPMSIQKLRLGADRQGRLTAIGHEVWSHTARYEESAEQTAVFSRSLYAAPNRLTRHRLVALDLHRGEWMRAPGEAPGLMAVEVAMDELAEKLGLDPIELRMRNEPAQDPERKVPFSSRALVPCMREGAASFGWDQRNPRPASVRDGRHLIGIGMSATIRPNAMRPAKAEASISADGRVTARLDMTDIGTGSYTVLTQIAADTLGVPMDAVTVLLADSRYPQTAGSGGSFGAASSGTALHYACRALRAKIVEAARRTVGSPFEGAELTEANLANGEIQAGNKHETLADLMPLIAPDGLTAQGAAEPGASYKAFSQYAYGAQFAEVAVDMDSGEIRLRRMLGVFAAGHILNPKIARSQLLGGMIWGVGAALMEENVVDPRYGQFVNHDLAEYHVPVHADIPDVEAVFLEEQDDKGNPLGIKGIGELGICGAGAAVANAVYNATGIRVRDYPITLDKLLPKLVRNDREI